MIIATVIIAISTTIYTIYARRQWQVMSTTLDEMKSGGTETKSQIDRMISETNRIADAMTNNVRQSKRAFDATIENVKLDQRAWIGTNKLTTTPYEDGKKTVIVKEGQPFIVDVFFTNSGKTPALNVKGVIRTGYLKAGVSPNLTEKEARDQLEATNGVMQPNATSFVRSHPFTPPFNKVAIDQLTNGSFVLYVLGMIKYDDIFHRHHVTSFCWYVDPDLTTFSPCPTYNEAD